DLQPDGGQPRRARAHAQADGRDARGAVAATRTTPVSGRASGRRPPRRGPREGLVIRRRARPAATSRPRALRGWAAALGFFLSGAAQAFGPSGHRIAGIAAEPLLCPRAAAEVASLSDGRGLAEIGPWADRIRSDDAWRHTAPWHYMNIGDDEPLEAYRHPPEGDVWWAVERHAARLAEPGDAAER